MKELADTLIDCKCEIICVDPSRSDTSAPRTYVGIIKRITPDFVVIQCKQNQHTLNRRYIFDIIVANSDLPKHTASDYANQNCKNCDYWNNGICRQDNKRLPGDSQSCVLFAKKSNSSDFCFLTSACVSHKGLPDNCEELTVLRHFRDSYMKSTPEGTQLVELYYRIAPEIVKKIEHSQEKDALYEDIYCKVCTCVQLIQEGNLAKTQELYTVMLKELMEKF